MSKKLAVIFFAMIIMAFTFIGFVFSIYKLIEWIEEKYKKRRHKKEEKKEIIKLLEEIKAELKATRLIRK